MWLTYGGPTDNAPTGDTGPATSYRLFVSLAEVVFSPSVKRTRVVFCFIFVDEQVSEAAVATLRSTVEGWATRFGFDIRGSWCACSPSLSFRIIRLTTLYYAASHPPTVRPRQLRPHRPRAHPPCCRLPRRARLPRSLLPAPHPCRLVQLPPSLPKCLLCRNGRVSRPAQNHYRPRPLGSSLRGSDLGLLPPPRALVPSAAPHILPPLYPNVRGHPRRPVARGHPRRSAAPGHVRRFAGPGRVRPSERSGARRLQVGGTPLLDPRGASAPPRPTAAARGPVPPSAGATSSTTSVGGTARPTRAHRQCDGVSRATTTDRGGTTRLCAGTVGGATGPTRGTAAMRRCRRRGGAALARPCRPSVEHVDAGDTSRVLGGGGGRGDFSWSGGVSSCGLLDGRMRARGARSKSWVLLQIPIVRRSWSLGRSTRCARTCSQARARLSRLDCSPSSLLVSRLALRVSELAPECGRAGLDTQGDRVERMACWRRSPLNRGMPEARALARCPRRPSPRCCLSPLLPHQESLEASEAARSPPHFVSPSRPGLISSEHECSSRRHRRGAYAS